MVSIFNYGFPQATEAFEKAGIRLVSLTNYNVLIEIAIQQKQVGEHLIENLNQWRENPSEWMQTS